MRLVGYERIITGSSLLALWRERTIRNHQAGYKRVRPYRHASFCVFVLKPAMLRQRLARLQVAYLHIALVVRQTIAGAAATLLAKN